MNVALIEDEPPALAHLEALLQRVEPGARVVARLRTVREARDWIAAGAPADLVLADVQLGDGLSLEALSEPGFDAPVVFVTAWDRHLVAALSANGVAYLLKPLREADLRAALAKVRRLERHFLAGLARELRAPAPRVIGRRGLDWVGVPADAIAWCSVRDGAAWLRTRAGEELLLEESLQTLAERLDPARFFRANRWTLVALDAVRRVRAEGRGRLSLILEPPSPEPVVVAQENAAAFRAWFGM